MADARAVTAATSEAPLPQACRNCGHALGSGDEYCPSCGQETRVALPTARQFMREAAGRYVALDGRLWRTLGALMVHPGFLTREYFAGRRRRYIRPGRLFLVTSLVAFAAIRLSIGTAEDLIVHVPDPAKLEGGAAAGADETGTAGTPSRKASPSRPAVVKGDAGDTKAGRGEAKAERNAAKARRSDDKAEDDVDENSAIIKTDDLDVSFDHEFNVNVMRDSNNLVPQVLRDRIDRFNQLPRSAKLEQMVNNTLRYGPYAAFALLPAFAVLLAMVYPLPSRRYPHRPRRFAGHLVFAAHNHAFLFALTTLLVLLPMPELLLLALVVAGIVYLLVALRAVYGGGWTLTIVRSGLLFLAYVLLFALVTFGLLVAALLLR